MEFVLHHKLKAVIDVLEEHDVSEGDEAHEKCTCLSDGEVI